MPLIDIVIAKDNSNQQSISTSRYLEIKDGKIINAIAIANISPDHSEYAKYQYVTPESVTLLLDDEGKYDIGWEWDETTQDYINKNPSVLGFETINETSNVQVF